MRALDLSIVTAAVSVNVIVVVSRHYHEEAPLSRPSAKRRAIYNPINHEEKLSAEKKSTEFVQANGEN